MSRLPVANLCRVAVYWWDIEGIPHQTQLTGQRFQHHFTSYFGGWGWGLSLRSVTAKNQVTLFILFFFFFFGGGGGGSFLL